MNAPRAIDARAEPADPHHDRHFYRTDPRHPRHYHLMLDSTAVAFSTCVELIVMAARAQGQT